MFNRLLSCPLLALMFSLPASAGNVVINEVFYHAPDDIEELEWIELHNMGDEAVDLAGWKFSSGVRFQFPAEATLPEHGYLVLCKNKELFAEYYDAPVAGSFEGSLSNRGETLELTDANGSRIDSLTYQDTEPWPVAPDGYSASLERICPSADTDQVANWSASRLATVHALPAGSPGEQNASFAASLPPVVSSLVIDPRNPSVDEVMRVTATVAGADGRQRVDLLYRIVRPGSLGEEQVINMGYSADGRFAAEIPGQSAGSLVRFRVRAADGDGIARYYPSEHGLRPARSVYVMAKQEPANIPFGFVINTKPDDVEAARRVWQRGIERGGPFSRGPRANAQRMLDLGLDLQSPWFELTVNQPLDAIAVARLRSVFQQLQDRRAEVEADVLGAADLAAAMQEIPGQLQSFRQEISDAIARSVPSNVAEQFQSTQQENQGPPGPEQFLQQMLSIEKLWFALGMQFEFSDQQLRDVRRALQAAQQARTKQMPVLQKLMTGEGDFQDVMVPLGAVEQQMWRDLKQVVSFRQNRFARQWSREQPSPMRPRSGQTKPLPPRGQSAFVLVDHQTKQPEVFDFVNIRERSAGYKIRLHKDRPLRHMTTCNLIFEYNDRFVLAEPLAFELYRRVGNPTCQTDFVRLWVDDNLIGYHLLFEQPNRAFLRRNNRNADGDLYKLIWYGRGIEGQHEKKTNLDRGHEDLRKVVQLLEASDGLEQWKTIQKHFNVDQVINYFAVNMCLSHWDGFFNNFFAYHDVGGTNRWELYPWDQDKTWGFYDGIGSSKVFVDMPLTFGMEGDVPPGGGEAKITRGSWWRPGGHFSKPLLANPKFRKRFLTRIREILDEIYSTEGFFPTIDALAARLRPEIPIRAAAVGESSEQAMARFEANIESLKRHLVERRAFLLGQAELNSLE